MIASVTEPLQRTLAIHCSRLWKLTGIEISVHHFPPGTSKWNKIEHRLLSFISMNWRATPLVSYRVIVDLISATSTETGLTVRCELDTDKYPKDITVADHEMAAINMTRDEFHGEWNHLIRPRIKTIIPLFPTGP